MELNKPTVDAYEKIMLNPSEYNVPIHPLSECFSDCEIATRKDVLYEQYRDSEAPNMPKVIFYIVMDQQYPNKIGNAPSGHSGYFLQFNKKA